ncbi:RE1 [Symbiodinium sp. CCMP2592]|nr:RE1 [Symbiodinium sp. CCMP2592]
MVPSRLRFWFAASLVLASLSWTAAQSTLKLSATLTIEKSDDKAKTNEQVVQLLAHAKEQKFEGNVQRFLENMVHQLQKVMDAAKVVEEKKSTEVPKDFTPPKYRVKAMPKLNAKKITVKKMTAVDLAKRLDEGKAEQGCSRMQALRLRRLKMAATVILTAGITIGLGKADGNGKGGLGMRGQWERPHARNTSWWSNWPGYRPEQRDAQQREQQGDGNREAEQHDRPDGGNRRASAQSTTITDESLDPSEEPKESSDAGSASTKGAPKTGKDHVPEYDGKTAMREYARRVKLFESSTGIDPSYRAQKLMEKLSGQAWMATESLDLEDLKHPNGVQRLLDHLWQELEPLEHLRTFTTLAEFYKDFRRSPGEEFVEFDMKFRAHLKRLEEVGAKLEGLNVAYWFLEKSGLSSDLRKQVVAAASGEYDYPKLRKALMAIVPKVKKDEEHAPSATRPFNRQWKPRNNQPRQVNATTGEEEDRPDPDGEEADDQVGPEELEGELEVLLTQAARKRAEIERARGFSKPESATAREARIKEMKSKMPCSACKANGPTVYGHWHGDAECPFRRGAGADKDRSREKSVLAVVEEELSDSEDDILDPPASSIFHSTTILDGTELHDEHDHQAPPYHVYSNGGEPDRNRLALSDTCCARTVAGKKWAQRHLRYLRARGEDVFVINEARPFRFGGGPRVMSEYAVIMPLIVLGASRLAWIRVSIVDQDVPLLLSKTALKMLGMVMDLEKSMITLRELETQVHLRETQAGLCGFEINLDRSGRRLEAPPQVLIDTDREVVLEDDVPGDQVMMVKKIRPEVPDGAQDRTTRESVERCEDQARKLYRECDFRYESLLELVRLLPIHRRARHRGINGKPGPVNEAWVAGLFVHGNQSGVTKRTSRYPHVVRYINSFTRDKIAGAWSSFSLAKNISTDVHVDCHNHKEASSVTVTFGDFTGGQLWVAQSDGEGGDCTWKQDRHGRTIPGTLISTCETPYLFNPQVPHATHEWSGERWCLSMYTVRCADQVDEDTKKALKKLRFPLSSRGTSRTLGDAVHAVHDMSSHREPHQHEDDVSHDMKCANTPQLLEEFGEPACSVEGNPSVGGPRDVDAGATAEGGVTKEALREHNLDRLKELWGAVRPPKKSATGLPANWKKFDRPALKHIYATQVAPDLGRDNDLHWDRWSKPTLILEIEMWAVDAAEELQRDRDLETASTEPLCPQCGIPMMVRTNRMTREDVYGCRRYPACKETLPLRYDGRPTREVQKQMEASEQIAKAKENHKKLMAKQAAKSKRVGEMGRALSSSDGSWAVAGSIPIEEVSSSEEEKDKKYNTNLTKEEMAMIVAMRDKNRGYPKDTAAFGVKIAPRIEQRKLRSIPRRPLSPSEIEERILLGNSRRRALKKGVMKRLLGNARAIVAGVLVTTAALAGAAASAVPSFSRMRPDVLEICGQEAAFTSSFSRWGWRHVEPVHLSSDLCDEGNRDNISRWIDESAPRLVIVSDCCPRIVSPGRVGVKEAQAIRRQRKREDRIKPVCNFLKHVIDMQIKRGDQALVELALHAAPEVAVLGDIMIRHPHVRHIPRFPQDCNRDARTGWLTTCEFIEKELAQIRDEGARDESSHHVSSRKSTVAKAVCRGFTQYIKEHEPDRLRRMLRSLATRIRGKLRNGDRRISDTRWSEKNILKALGKWSASAVYAVDQPHESDEEMIPDIQEPEQVRTREAEEAGSEMQPVEHVRRRLGSHGITFEVPPGRRVSEAVRQGLIKAHCNLGHPSKEDFIRFLKLGGAKQEVLEAVPWMKCMTCAHARRPSAHRTTNIPPCQVTFGDEVQLDCICVHDSAKQAYWFLSVIDRATSYHIVEILRDHSPEELYRAFDRGWARWAGPPIRATVDMEGGFQGREFWEQVSQAGTCLTAIAGTAHWQAGKVERHNQIVKDMIFNVVRQTNAFGREEMRRLTREVSWAKNSLTREHGWAPVALVFGREPRVFGELHQDGNPAGYHPSVGETGSDVAVRMRYRYHAKMEFIRSQARQMLLKTAHNRTRKIPIPKVGQLVFFWREARGKRGDNHSSWHGPGYVVGIQDRNAWVTIGGRSFLVAGEHLREAVGDEKHFGNPEIQKAIALFRKIPSEATYEDLIGQKGPEGEPGEVEQQPLGQDLTENLDMEVDAMETEGLSAEHASMVPQVGWHVDQLGNPVLVSHKVWAFRSPEPRYPGERFPYRTTWACHQGQWKCLEKEVKWAELEDHHQFIPGGPAAGLITIFQSRTRKEMCLDDVPQNVKRQKRQVGEAPVHAVSFKKTESKTKLKRMMEKEIPYDCIPADQREVYKAAEDKEWKSWLDYESCEILSLEESRRIERERPDRILPSRYVFRDKNAGLLGPDGRPLPVKAKARLCLQGHLCPDSKTGLVQVDSPTVERVSTMIFLHLVTSLGWSQNWFVGDISNAFLQGAPLKDKPDMFMRQPKQGLKGMAPGQIIKLLKPVYGRPDAPRAWYEELSRILQEELGFTKCMVDPAMFMLRDSRGALRGIMIVHVDDVMFCHDGSAWGHEVADKVHARFPFGTWLKVADQESGITYCGKEIKIKKRDGEIGVVLPQSECLYRWETPTHGVEQRETTDVEKTDYRSVVGSLQWLAVQSRPDVAFECNQLQKRISNLRVADLVRANKAVREVIRNRLEIEFRPLGEDAELVTYHDAGLYSSVGVEIDERECEDILQRGNEKRLVYSQKGACIGFVRKGATDHEQHAHMNLIDWKSSTNRRVVESSFAAETHAAIMGHNMSRFAQVLLSEIRYGSKVISAIEDDGWQQLAPVTLVTDCRSIYDTIHKDGQHVGEKGNIVHAVLLRQLLTTRGRDNPGKAKLLWVPTRCQLADGFTKAGRGSDIREQLTRGLLFHESALKRKNPQKRTGQRDGYTSVNVEQKA